MLSLINRIVLLLCCINIYLHAHDDILTFFHQHTQSPHLYADHIDIANGTVFHEENDLTLEAPIPTHIKRKLDSNSRSGWQWNFVTTGYFNEEKHFIINSYHNIYFQQENIQFSKNTYEITTDSAEKLIFKEVSSNFYQIVQHQFPTGFNHNYQYDQSNRLTRISITHPNANYELAWVLVEYPENFEFPSKITNDKQQSISYHYDALTGALLNSDSNNQTSSYLYTHLEGKTLITEIKSNTDTINFSYLQSANTIRPNHIAIHNPKNTANHSINWAQNNAQATATIQTPLEETRIYYIQNGDINLITQADRSQILRQVLIERDSSGHITKKQIQNSSGNTLASYLLSYDSFHNLTKQSLVGNLSGLAEEESYSIHYTYHPVYPKLLSKIHEDNGNFERFIYNPDNWRLQAKLQGNNDAIFSRHFIEEDAYGLPYKLFYDNGNQEEKNDLNAVTHRKFVSIHRDYEKSEQAIRIKKGYIDLDSQQELIEEEVLTQNEEDHIQINTDTSFPFNAKTTTPNAIHIENTFYDNFQNPTHYRYDTLGRVIEIRKPEIVLPQNKSDFPTETMQYNALGQLSSRIDPAGNETNIEHTIRSQISRITYPDNSSLSFVYNLSGQLVTSIDQIGNRTHYTYDFFGNIRSIQEESSNKELIRNQYFDTSFLLPQETQGPQGEKTLFYYNSDGTLKEKTILNPNGNLERRSAYQYDALKQLTEEKQWFGNGPNDFLTLSQQYNEQSLVAHQSIKQEAQTLPCHSESTINTLGQHVLQETVLLENGSAYITTYDALNSPVEITHVSNNNDVIDRVCITYDIAGNKTSELREIYLEKKKLRDSITVWQFDNMNRVVQVYREYQSNEKKASSISYDKKGRVKTLTRPSGKTIYYDYDAFDRLIKIYDNKLTFHYLYSYDLNNIMTSAQDIIHQQNMSRTVDQFGNILQEDLNGNTIKNTFDLIGRRTQLQLPDASKVLYQYDSEYLSSVSRISSQEQCLYQFSYPLYNSAGQPEILVLPKNMGEIHYQWNAQSQIINSLTPWTSHSLSKTKTTEFFSSGQMHDPVGEFSTEYEYDSIGQLKRAYEWIDSSYKSDSSHTFLSKNHIPVTSNELGQVLNDLHSNYEYDKDGNCILVQNGQHIQELTYDTLGRLIESQSPKQLKVKYYYDGLHRRSKKEVFTWNSLNNTWQLESFLEYLYDGTKDIGALDNTGSIVEFRTLNQDMQSEIGATLSIELDQDTYIALHDNFGSINALVSLENKSVSESYRHNSYGLEHIFNSANKKINQSHISNPWRYQGKRHEEETGFIHFGKRDYDPLKGQWLTPDPMGSIDSPNPYAFTKSNPIAYRDHDGLLSWSGLINDLHNIATNISTALSSFTHSNEFKVGFEAFTEALVGRTFLQIIGDPFHNSSRSGTHGMGEVHDLVRISHINGILNGPEGCLEAAQLISNAHGNNNVHYYFVSTGGLAWDLATGLFSKIGWTSPEAYELAAHWRELIEDMGGVDSGGSIIHYAHSLGGTFTEQAKNLLSEEELSMIHVVTLGAASVIKDDRLASTKNYISVKDIIPILGNPFACLSTFWKEHHHLYFEGFESGTLLIDHLIKESTYYSIIERLGNSFTETYGIITQI